MSCRGLALPHEQLLLVSQSTVRGSAKRAVDRCGPGYGATQGVGAGCQFRAEDTREAPRGGLAHAGTGAN